MKKVEEIKQRRQNTHIMNRLRKATAIEKARDILEVKTNISLVRSPAAKGGNKILEKAVLEEVCESDTEMQENAPMTMETEA